LGQAFRANNPQRIEISNEQRKTEMHENSLKNLQKWQPGQSGNLNGRPRVRLTERFISDVSASWERHDCHRAPGTNAPEHSSFERHDSETGTLWKGCLVAGCLMCPKVFPGMPATPSLLIAQKARRRAMADFPTAQKSLYFQNNPLCRDFWGAAMSALGILTVLLPIVFAFSWLLWRASI